MSRQLWTLVVAMVAACGAGVVSADDCGKDRACYSACQKCCPQPRCHHHKCCCQPLPTGAIVESVPIMRASPVLLSQESFFVAPAVRTVASTESFRVVREAARQETSEQSCCDGLEAKLSRLESEINSKINRITDNLDRVVTQMDRQNKILTEQQDRLEALTRRLESK